MVSLKKISCSKYFVSNLSVISMAKQDTIEGKSLFNSVSNLSYRADFVGHTRILEISVVYVNTSTPEIRTYLKAPVR